MKESKSIQWGADITHAYHEMMKAEEPTFCNFNGVYIYGGCTTPPHGFSEKKTEKCLLAGMAMQSLIGVISSEMGRMESVLRDCKKRDLKSVHEWVAKASMDYADALLEEINRKES